MVAFVCLVMILLLAAPVAAGAPADNLLAWNDELPNGGWRPWAPREEIAPQMGCEGKQLVMSGGGMEYSSGAWVREVDGIGAGEVFDFRVMARVSAGANVQECVVPRIVWKGRFGPDVQPFYATHFRDLGDDAWEIREQVKAPPGTSGVRVELHLRWARRGSVSYEEASLAPGVEAASRKVRVATIYWRPQDRTTMQKNIDAFLLLVEKAGAAGADVILLTEHFKTVGVGTDAARFAEEVPGGPLFTAISARARKYDTYIVYGDFLREGPYISNAAVIVDRQGQLAGIYRKVQLTAEEAVDRRPGDEIPVFDLDFGRVGVLICHDTTFPEPARILGVKGAEMVLVPIWGGAEATMRTRAQENAYWWVTAGFDVASMVIDPTGAVRARTWKDDDEGIARFEINLEDRYPVDYLGEWENAVWKQRRPGLYGPLIEGLR